MQLATRKKLAKPFIFLAALIWPSFVIHHISSLCNQNNSSKAELPSSISVRDQLSIRCHHGLPYRFKIVDMNAFVGMIPDCQVNGSPAGWTEFC